MPPGAYQMQKQILNPTHSNKGALAQALGHGQKPAQSKTDPGGGGAPKLDWGLAASPSTGLPEGPEGRDHPVHLE